MQVIKRPAFHSHPKQSDIYISHKTTFPIALKRINKLLYETELNQIELHGLGASIPKTIQLALIISKKDKNIQLSINTDTVSLIDDIIENNETKQQIRQNSAIHIRLIKLS